MSVTIERNPILFNILAKGSLKTLAYHKIVNLQTKCRTSSSGLSYSKTQDSFLKLFLTNYYLLFTITINNLSYSDNNKRLAGFLP